jgi:hypothetical protein
MSTTLQTGSPEGTLRRRVCGIEAPGSPNDNFNNPGFIIIGVFVVV